MTVPVEHLTQQVDTFLPHTAQVACLLPRQPTAFM